MAETQINQNQIADGTGSKIKILNVVQDGSLYRSDGTKFTNFGSSNYLTIGGVVQNGIFSQAQNVLNFGDFFSSADTWEINGSYKLTDEQEYQYIIGSNSNNEGVLLQGMDYQGERKINLWIPSLSIDSFATVNVGMTLNQKYYFRVQFTGNFYKLYINTDGQTYDNTTLEINEENNNKISDFSSIYIGKSDTSYLKNGEIDLADWNIKKNGQIWWKGVETI